MQPALEKYDVGVIIGRFQVHELHKAHLELISHVCDNHDRVFIVLGVSPLPVSTANPLDFEARKQMILAEYPDVNVFYVRDQPNDEVWSRKVDEIIADNCPPSQTSVLYGSRDSFIAHYSGKLPTRELLAESVLSGTAIRRQIARSSARSDPNFRAGVIWASQSRFPTVFTTVDVAILDNNRMLLGRKEGEKLFRFIGGFADPASDSFEVDAQREVREETSLEVGELTYIGSAKIPDWRYRGEPDCIKTMMFAAKYLYGRPQAQDDIEEVKWFEYPHFSWKPALLAHQDFQLQLVPQHRPLYRLFISSLTPPAQFINCTKEDS